MAKSLRSKSKRAYRAVKRNDPKSIYNATDALRVARLSQRLQDSAKQPKLSAVEEAEKADNLDEGMQVETSGNGSAEAEPLDTVQEEQAPKNVSTHGPRMSGRTVWKAKRKGLQVCRPPKTVVWGPKKMGGKPHRRR